MKKNLVIAMTALVLASCGANKETLTTPEIENFNYTVDQFADLQILRYRVPEIEQLSLQQQEMLYYLTEAALQGRDILYDQNGKYNLAIRQVLEAIYTDPKQEKISTEFKALEVYLKRVWVSNGIHHHYSGDKFIPTFSQNFFESAVRGLSADQLSLKEGETLESLLATLIPVIFDPTVDVKRVNQDAGADLVLTSAGNYYDGVTQAEAENFYDAMKVKGDLEPISYGMNSKLVKKEGVIQEEVYKVDGLYSEALKKVVFWLEKAKNVAENDQQRAVIEKLIEFNKTGNLRTFDEYAI
ncbi:MAG TPA: hypothetical protein VJ856_00990, partial [Paludibacteraceae bacterium]|nr:hypothetical protein [Paludibacteraceae bacterium]